MWLIRRARSQLWVKASEPTKSSIRCGRPFERFGWQFLQGIERGARPRTGSECLDPVDDIGDVLVEVDVLVDRRGGLIDHEALDLGVVGKGCIGGDEGVSVGEVDFAHPLTTASGAIRQPSTISTAASTVHPRPRERRLEGLLVGDSGWVRLHLAAQRAVLCLQPCHALAQIGLLVHLHDLVRLSSSVTGRAVTGHRAQHASSCGLAAGGATERRKSFFQTAGLRPSATAVGPRPRSSPHAVMATRLSSLQIAGATPDRLRGPSSAVSSLSSPIVSELADARG